MAARDIPDIPAAGSAAPACTPQHSIVSIAKRAENRIVVSCFFLVV
jgi:hypothetical protein